MNKIIFILIFIGILFLGDRIFALIISKIIDHSNQNIAQLYSKSSSEKIIILGNSYAYRNLNAPLINKKFGVEVSNYSMDGGSTFLAEILLKDYINLYRKPTLVILEVSSLLNDQESLITLRPFQSKSKTIDNALKEYHKSYYYAGLISHLFRYNNSYSINMINKVFSEENTILESTKFKQTKKSRPILDISKYKININSLTNIIYMCKSLDIELRLIITPSNSNYDLYLKEFEKKFPNQSIWDFSKIKNLRSNDYYDSNHLNREGVLKLLKEMKKVNFF